MRGRQKDFDVIDSFQRDLDLIAGISVVPTILDVVCRTTGMRFAAIARVTKDRWIACQVLDQIDFGLKPGGELAVETTICSEVRDNTNLVVIDNVAEDASYRGHPSPAAYGFQSYISVPIVHRDGRFFGTLCAIDPLPARLNNPETIGMFKLFAELIASHIDAAESIVSAQNDLKAERDLSELREQFVAVLGHDLRNPVAAIDSGAKILARQNLDEKSRKVVGLMQGSLHRIHGLIDNVMDLANARLGKGIALRFDTDEPLLPALAHVVAELQAVYPERRISMSFALNKPDVCDAARLAQLFSNLVANALTHGSQDAPIETGAEIIDGHMKLWVSNSGSPIQANTLENLFRPFFRGKLRSSQQGLGLGLYIASEIARLHGGTLTAQSTDEETRFTFEMQVDGPQRTA